MDGTHGIITKGLGTRTCKVSILYISCADSKESGILTVAHALREETSKDLNHLLTLSSPKKEHIKLCVRRVEDMFG